MMNWLDNGFHMDLAGLAVLIPALAVWLTARRVGELRRREQRREARIRALEQQREDDEAPTDLDAYRERRRRP